MNEYMLVTFNLTEYQYYPALLCICFKHPKRQQLPDGKGHVFIYIHIKKKFPHFLIFLILFSHRVMLYINRAVSISSTYLSSKMYTYIQKKFPYFKNIFNSLQSVIGLCYL